MPASASRRCSEWTSIANRGRYGEPTPCPCRDGAREPPVPGHQPTWSETNPEGRWRAFSREEVLARDKASLDLFWLKDKSLTDLDNLPEPEELAEEIIDGLEAGLASLRAVLREFRA